MIATQSLPCRLGIVDRDQTFLQKLGHCVQALPQFESGFIARDVSQALRHLQTQAADILLLEYTAGTTNSERLITRLLQDAPDRHIIYTTNTADRHSVHQAFRCNAHGLILKNELLCADQMLRLFEDVRTHGAFLSPGVQAALAAALRPSGQAKPGHSPLTAREEQILQLLVDGRTTRHIAGLFGTATSTVRSQTKNLYRKLNVHSRLQLVRQAEALSLLP